MNEVNRTLYIPLYGKAQVSRRNIILRDRKAEEIWDKAAFSVKGQASSKWLAYFMAMRARVFDKWTDNRLKKAPDALVLHIGCGLDSRCLRVKEKYSQWIDADLGDVIERRGEFFRETANCRMMSFDASNPDDVDKLPDSAEVIVILEGISMYLTNERLKALLANLRKKYEEVHLLMDIYTEFGARISKIKNPVKTVGVARVYGVANILRLVAGTGLKVKGERSMTPDGLIDQLNDSEKMIFRSVYAGRLARRIYRLFELESVILR